MTDQTEIEQAEHAVRNAEAVLAGARAALRAQAATCETLAANFRKALTAFTAEFPPLTPAELRRENARLQHEGRKALAAGTIRMRPRDPVANSAVDRAAAYLPSGGHRSGHSFNRGYTTPDGQLHRGHPVRGR
jgi:multidrug resistance efflux pump